MLNMSDSTPQPPAPSHQQPTYVPVAVHAPRNSLATAALVLGIVGFVITLVPLFIGLFAGGILNILAFIFGIVGAAKSGKLGGLGLAAAVTGIVLSCVAFILMFFGAGTIW
jgi:hypothetical protein